MSGDGKIRQIADDIVARINDGTYPPGSKLPSVTELRKKYGVSEKTVENALTWLEATATVVGVDGSGRFVAEG